jgi:hypothetical protein
MSLGRVIIKSIPSPRMTKYVKTQNCPHESLIEYGVKRQAVINRETRARSGLRAEGNETARDRKLNFVARLIAHLWLRDCMSASVLNEYEILNFRSSLGSDPGRDPRCLSLRPPFILPVLSCFYPPPPTPQPLSARPTMLPSSLLFRWHTIF